jgi:preprotein translocase subunit SecF
VIISSKLDLTEEERRLMIEEIQTAFDVDEETLAPQVDKVSASMSGEITYQSIMACIVVVVCMLVYITIRFEFLFGVAAIIALLHDILLVVGMFAIFRIQVNTPFVAALLTILGYSINNTIIIFDRVRENRKRYKKYDYENLVDDSIQQCLRRSINTSITTLLTITTLYVLGVDDVKSFALPLIVGFLGGTYSSLFLAAPIWYKLRKAVDNSQKKKRQLAK